MRAYCLIILIFLSNIIIAGDHKGNGANVIICEQEDGEKEVLFLDYIEAKIRRDMIIYVGEEDRPYIEILHDLISKIEQIDYARAKLYRRYLKSFNSEVKFITEYTLENTITNSLLACKNDKGTIQQLVIQITPRFKEDKRYFIDKNLWNQLSQKEKAGVILHEFIMREIGYKRDPEAVRYLTSLYSSHNLHSYRLKEYFELLKKLGFSFASFKQIAIDLNKEFHFNNTKKQLKTAYAYDGYIINYDKYTLPLSNKIPIKYSWQGEVLSIPIKNPAPLQADLFWPIYEIYDDYRESVEEPMFFILNINDSEFRYKIKNKEKIFPQKMIQLIFSTQNWSRFEGLQVPFNIFYKN